MRKSSPYKGLRQKLRPEVHLPNSEAESHKRRVKDATDIVQLISERTNLARSGRSFKGLCPFHDEKTPSFYVNPEGQFFKCFGCGKGGDVFTFVMETERVDFPQAVALLSERANIPMPDPRSHRSPDEARLYQEGRTLVYRLNDFAARFFSEQLWSDSGLEARKYLEERGITKETAYIFGIGYAPDSWDALCQELRGRKAADRNIVAAGLAVERKDASGVYDRFRNRLIFPIVDVGGRCVGFGARALSDEDNPKYLNSPDTPIFSKGKLLFGLDLARKNLDDGNRVLLMEGYTDVIMAAQMGFANAVATLGTSLTPDHVRVLRRFSDSVLVLFDSDKAGMAAAERGLDIFFEGALPARVVTLEEGLDPCDYLLQKGVAPFSERLAASVDLFDFKLAAVRKSHDITTAHGSSAAIKDLMGTVSKVTDPIMSGELRRRAAEAFGLPETLLAAEMASSNARNHRGRSNFEVQGTHVSGDETVPDSPRQMAERELARAIVACPSAIAEAETDVGGFEKLQDSAASELLLACSKMYKDLGELDLEEVATTLSGRKAIELLADLGSSRRSASESGGIHSSIDTAIARVQRVLLDLKRLELSKEKNSLSDELRLADSQRQMEIAERLAEVQRQLQEINR